jgi:hypothetical protein
MGLDHRHFALFDFLLDAHGQAKEKKAKTRIPSP